MKIYAGGTKRKNARESEDELDKFIGKDLWVRIKDLKRNEPTYIDELNTWISTPKEYYAKIISKYKDDSSIYICKCVNVIIRPSHRRAWTKILRIDRDKIELVKPLDVLTTEELTEDKEAE